MTAQPVAAVLPCKWWVRVASGRRADQGGKVKKRKHVAEDILSGVRSSKGKSRERGAGCGLAATVASNMLRLVQARKCTGQRHQLLKGRLWLSGKRLCKAQHLDATEGIGTELVGKWAASRSWSGTSRRQCASRGWHTAAAGWRAYASWRGASCGPTASTGPHSAPCLQVMSSAARAQSPPCRAWAVHGAALGWVQVQAAADAQ